MPRRDASQQKSAETASTSIPDALVRAKRGRVVCLFAKDCDVAHEELETWASTTRPPSTLVTLAWETTPKLVDELDHASAALARAALALYPALYASAVDRELRSDRELSPPTATQLEERASRTSNVSARAVQRIIECCRDGNPPLLEELSGAERVRQLAFALDPEQLVVELLVRSSEPPARGVLFAFGRGADWVARNSNARVVILVPDAFLHSPELDGVTYGALAVGRPQALTTRNTHSAETPDAASNDNADPAGKRKPHKRSREPEASSKTDLGSFTSLVQSFRERARSESEANDSSPSVTVGAVIGRPHPASDAEQRLHERLSADAELGPLFRFNQIVKTRFGTSPRVDLVWPEGKLVVELDGSDHARAGKFCHDRERDYQLMLTGYRVIRVPDLFVLMDTQLTLERIRTAVRYLKREKNGL